MEIINRLRLNSVGFSPDGTCIAVGAAFRTVDAGTVMKFELESWATFVDFSPDRTRIVTTSIKGLTTRRHRKMSYGRRQPSWLLAKMGLALSQSCGTPISEFGTRGKHEP